MSYDIEKEIELFREKLKQEKKVVIEDGRELYTVTSSQLLDFLKNLEDDSINLEKKEKIEKYNNILLEFDNLFINGNFEYLGIFPCIAFTGSIFNGYVKFKDVVFAGEFIFDNAEFNGRVEFINIEFPFEFPAFFSGAKFKGKTKFINIKMLFQHNNKNYIGFRNTEFNGLYAVFENIICKDIDFEDAKFFTNMDFSDIKCKVANFKGIVAKEYISFDKMEVIKRADFNDSYIDNISFGGIKFHEVNFSNNNFQYFQFGHVEVTDIAYFNKVKFTEDIDFSENVIFNQVDFSNATFKKKANFATCTFNTAPLFHNTKLHQDTSFEGTQFLRCSEEEDYRAYRTLKQHMNGVHAKLEENMFFALEQRTRRYLDAQDMKNNWFSVTVSYLYDAISGYGQDLLKPVLWLVCTWYAFAGIFSFPGMVGLSDKLKGTWFESIFPGFGYSTQNIFNPLSAVNFLNIDRAFYPYNPVIAFLGWFEAILSVAFITLWLLAVRRRFQKGE